MSSLENGVGALQLMILIYHTACGGELTNDPGILKTPYHPSAFPHNRVCIYKIVQPVGKAIIFNFTAFDIGGHSWLGSCYSDYVEVALLNNIVYTNSYDNRKLQLLFKH